MQHVLIAEEVLKGLVTPGMELVWPNGKRAVCTAGIVDAESVDLLAVTVLKDPFARNVRLELIFTDLRTHRTETTVLWTTLPPPEDKPTLPEAGC